MSFKYITFLSGRFFDGVSSGIFMLALPWVILEQTHNGSLVAVTALLCTLASFVFSPFLSTMIDRHSRRAILFSMQVCQASTALIVFLSYLNHFSHTSFLILAQIIFWLSGDLAWKANNALVQENFAQEEYPKITSYQEITMQVTTLGSGVFGIILLSQWSMLAFALIATLASSLSALCYRLMPYQQQIRSHNKVAFVRQLLDYKRIILSQTQSLYFLALSCLSYPALTFLGKLVPIYFHEIGLDANWFASWKLCLGLGALLSGVLIRYLLSAYGAEKLMIYSMALIAVALFLQSVFNQLGVIISIALALGFLSSINRISRMNKMHLDIAIEERGRVEGALHMFCTLVQSLGYSLIALLSHVSATQLGFSLLSIFILLGALIMFNLYQKQLENTAKAM